MVAEYDSTLHDVRMENEVEQTFDSLARDRSDLYDAELIPSSSRKSQDLEKLKEVQEELKDLIGKKGVDWWMETAVLYPIGPEQMQKIEEKGINLQGLSYKLLINHTNATALLAVKRRQTVELTTAIIDAALAGLIDHQPVLLSEPNSGYAIEMSYGEEPKAIEGPRDTKYALVFDEIYLESEARNAFEFYEYETGCNIVSTRPIGERESRLIEKKLGDDLKGHPLRLLEFDSPYTRNWAETSGNVDFIDIFYCDNQFGYRTPHESICLFLKFDLGQERRDGVEITLPRSNEFAAKAFSRHYMEPTRTNKYGDSFRRNEANWNKLIIYDFPSGFPTIESRLWLVNRISQANDIRFESIQPNVRYLDDFIDRRDADLMKVVAMELEQRSREENDDASWNVVRHNQGPNDEFEYFDIHFDQLTFGLNIVNSLVTHNDAEFRVSNWDSRGAELTPCLRRTITISRAIRVALDNTIRQFDYDLRTHFTKLTASQDPIMERADAVYYRLRIHEEWRDGSDVGIIGVEGWSPAAVREQFQKLEEILKPKSFGGCLQLLFGPGAVFAKSLERRYQGALLVEIDKHWEEVKLIGDAAEDAKLDLQGYSFQNTSIRCTIPAYFPVLNYGIRYYLTSDVMEGIKSSLGLQYLEHNWEQSIIEFEGTAAGYEKLMEVLEGLSQAILMKETKGRGSRRVCPTCLVPIDASMDFYRFQCGHVMCRQCANNKISNMDVGEVKCAQENCQKFVSPSDILNIIGSGTSRDFDPSRLHPLILKCKASILNSSEGKISECTTTDCPGLRFQSNGDLGAYKSCSSCHQTYCRKCLANPHRGYTCEKWAELQRDDPTLQEYLNTLGKEKVKKCPMCSSLVEKAGDGCSHMQCKCGCHFCWRCLYFVTKVAGSQPIYEHMKEDHAENPFVAPEQVAAEDLAIQDLLIDAHQPHRQQPLFRPPFDDSEDESDDDSDDDREFRREAGPLIAVDRQIRDRILIRQQEQNRQVMARLRAWRH